MTKLKRIKIQGWKSIKDSKDSIKLRQLNVFIGANGYGKSNLVSFFKLLNEMVGQRLQAFIELSGGANSVLHYGASVTRILAGHVTFETEKGTRDYQIQLEPAPGARPEALPRLIFRDELVDSDAPPFLDSLRRDRDWPPFDRAPESVEETVLVQAKESNEKAKAAFHLLDSCRVYQFHDTSSTSQIRSPVYIDDNRVLNSNGANLAAMLYRFKETEPEAYNRIVSTIRQIAPFFGDFELVPMAKAPDIRLNWREKGVEQIFGPHQMSDGALRAIALITLLLQPETALPSVIVIDEPELGLHPYAIGVLASLVKKASHHCQVILATQSPALLDEFDPEDVVVVDRESKESTFRRLGPDQLDSWLDEYSFSEAWEKNVFGGGPH
jgi:predicted ATPase